MTSAVHDDAASSACETAASTGSRTRNVVPRGPLDSMAREPPCRSAIHCAIVSPSPAPSAAARRIELHEAIEDLAPILGGDAGAAVGRRGCRTSAAVDRDVNGDRAAGRRVLDRVLQQIDHQPPQQLLVAAKRHVGCAGDVHATRALGREHADRPLALVDQVVEIESIGRNG